MFFSIHLNILKSLLRGVWAITVFLFAVCSHHPETWFSRKIQGMCSILKTLCFNSWIDVIELLFFLCCQDFKIQNIVGSCDVKFPIRLEGLAYSHGAFSSVSCTPCLFPNHNSLSYLLEFPCHCPDILLVFHSPVWTRALPWINLSNEAAKDCAADFCFRQDCSDWS